MGGWTPLHFAARDGFSDAVQALLESGADINRLGDGDHTSVLIIAIENGHFDLAKYLVEHGADVSQANDGGVSPVYAVLDTSGRPWRGLRFRIPARKKRPAWNCWPCWPTTKPISTSL